MEFVYFSSAEPELVDKSRLPSGFLNGCVSNSGEDHVEHQCRVASNRNLVHFVATAAVVLRDDMCVDGVCETEDSSRAVMCMGCAIEIVYGLQEQQRFTLFFFKF